MKHHLDYTTVHNKLIINDKNMTRFILACTIQTPCIQYWKQTQCCKKDPASET